MRVIGEPAFERGMVPSAVGAPFAVFAVFVDVAIFLSFVTPDQFLGVFNDNDSRVSYEDVLCEEMVSGDRGRAEDFYVHCFLVG